MAARFAANRLATKPAEECPAERDGRAEAERPADAALLDERACRWPTPPRSRSTRPCRTRRTPRRRFRPAPCGRSPGRAPPTVGAIGRPATKASTARRRQRDGELEREQRRRERERAAEEAPDLVARRSHPGERGPRAGSRRRSTRARSRRARATPRARRRPASRARPSRTRTRSRRRRGRRFGRRPSRARRAALRPRRATAASREPAGGARALRARRGSRARRRRPRHRLDRGERCGEQRPDDEEHLLERRLERVGRARRSPGAMPRPDDPHRRADRRVDEARRAPPRPRRSVVRRRRARGRRPRRGTLRRRRRRTEARGSARADRRAGRGSGAPIPSAIVYTATTIPAAP